MSLRRFWCALINSAGVGFVISSLTLLVHLFSNGTAGTGGTGGNVQVFYNFFFIRIEFSIDHLYHPHLNVLPWPQPNPIQNSVPLGIVFAWAATVERWHDGTEFFRELTVAPSVPDVVLPAPVLPTPEDFANSDFEFRTNIAAFFDEHFDIGGEFTKPL